VNLSILLVTYKICNGNVTQHMITGEQHHRFVHDKSRTDQAGSKVNCRSYD